MTREQAIHSMITHGFKVEQVGEIIKAVTPQEPKTGHWYYDEERQATGIYAICSNCDEKIYQTDTFKYCPNCGAKMVEPQESEET